MQTWTSCLCFSTLACSCYGPNFNKELKENLYLPYLCFHVKGFVLFWGGGFFLLSVNFFQKPFPRFLSGFKTNYSFVWIFFKCTF